MSGGKEREAEQSLRRALPSPESPPLPLFARLRTQSKGHALVHSSRVAPASMADDLMRSCHTPQDDMVAPRGLLKQGSDLGTMSAFFQP